MLGKPDTVERRLQRFLANPNVDWAKCCQALTVWVISSLKSDGPSVLPVDETSLNERLKVMAVSLAYRGRAIPLAWWCYSQRQWPMKHVQLVTTLLTWGAAGIDDGRTVLVQADRGIGNSPTLLRAIERMGWHYMVRVSKGVRLKIGEEDPVPFESLVRQPGGRWRGQVQAFKKAGWIKCWAEVYREKSHAEPWLVLTNYPPAPGPW